ncbi:MAG: oligosaccharide flippase family protein [Acidobacteria bacterium]|nr:oligosaccharide flippase family protein [Acidobacteriota bacterium]
MRTLEVPYWIVGVFIVVIVILAAPFIAFHWVNVRELSPQTVQQAVMIMGLCLTFQWPTSFYTGALMGLQRQVLLNVLNSVMATFRGLGAVIVLWLVSPTVLAFFSWQILSSALQTGLIAFFLWRNLPKAPDSPHFRGDLLLNIWRFAAGVTGITVMATLLTQTDKIILSRMLPLKTFGYYTLASTVAMTLYRFFGPVFSAVYPRFTNLIALRDEEGIKALYHKSAQLVSVIVLPAAIVLALFSKEILLLWTQDAATAENTYLLVSLLVIGTALNGLMNIPYALQLASGWTSLAFCVNIVSVAVLVPLMIMLTKLFGTPGAASVWVILNGGYVLFAIQLMHRRLLRREMRRWYLDDVGLPLGAALIGAGLGRWLISNQMPTLLLLMSLVVILAWTMFGSVLAAPQIREWFCNRILRIKVTYHGA